MLPSTYEHGILSPTTQLQTARRLPQPELDDERSRAKYSITIGTYDVVDVISYVETEPCAEEISSDTSMFPTTYWSLFSRDTSKYCTVANLLLKRHAPFRSWYLLHLVSVSIKHTELKRGTKYVKHLLTCSVALTVPVELWPPHIFYVRFRDSKFVQDGVVSHSPKLQLGGPGYLS
jgi:hypothetical protein